MKVNNEPETKALVAKFRLKYGEPGTVYYAPDGHIKAWQWRVDAAWLRTVKK